MLKTFFLAMSLHTDVQKKAQAELDAVVGRDRLPDLGDREKLPYMNAIFKEILRWRPIGPSGLPHAAIDDDEYGGYFVPKGAIMLPNIWSMNMDPDVFDHPETFDPQRYVDDPNLPLHTFGFGRRSVPSLLLAVKSDRGLTISQDMPRLAVRGTNAIH